jgi:hypothetical protein
MDVQAPNETASQAAPEAAGTPIESKETRKAKILADAGKTKLRARLEGTDEDPTPVEKPAENDGPKPEEKPPEKPKAKTSGRGKFVARIKALETELASVRGESKAEFLKALRADPGLLFREIADDPEIMVKLAEARQVSLDPVEQAKRIAEKIERDAKQREKDADDRVKATNARAAEANALAGVAAMLRSGIKDDSGKVLVAAKWPISTAMADDGEDIVWRDEQGKRAVSIPEAVLLTFKQLRDPLAKKRGRAVNEQETAALLEIALDQIESRQAGRGKYFGKAKTEKREEVPSPRTISSRGAPGRPSGAVAGSAAPKGQTKEAKKVAILENYRNKRLRERIAGSESA